MAISMESLPACADAPGLERWLRQALAPYYTVSEAAPIATPLVEVRSDVPLLDDPAGAACVWAGRVGAVACWQLHDAHRAIVARVASAPHGDLRVPEPIVKLHPFAYHQSWIGSGAGFNGYILGDNLVGCANIHYGRRLLLLVAEFVDASVVDYDGYWDGEDLLARLHLHGDDSPRQPRPQRPPGL